MNDKFVGDLHIFMTFVSLVKVVKGFCRSFRETEQVRIVEVYENGQGCKMKSMKNESEMTNANGKIRNSGEPTT